MRQMYRIDKRTEFLIKKAFKEGFERGQEFEARDLKSNSQFMYNARRSYVESNFVVGASDTVTFFKVITMDNGSWCGTFHSRQIADDYMRDTYPKKEYKIIEIDTYGKPVTL